MIADSVNFLETCPPSRLDAFDPRGRVVCALIAVMTLAAVRDAGSLAAGSVLPFLLLCVDWRARAAFLSRSVLNVNKIGIFICIFLPLTYPGERLWGIFSREGLTAALILVWKLNLMCVLLAQMVVSMGIPEIGNALGRLGFPLKLRMLLLLTMRYVLMLSVRMATMWRAVRIRSNDTGGLDAYRAFACMVGTTLVHSADRAERSAIAMRLRGGAEGFSQSSECRWTRIDSFLCAAFLLNSALILILPRIPAIN